MDKPIRTGCYVEFVQTFTDGYQRIVKGEIIHDYYDTDGFHYFTVKSAKGAKSITIGAPFVYRNLLEHQQGENSRIVERRAKKRGKKEKKRRERKLKRAKKKGL